MKQCKLCQNYISNKNKYCKDCKLQSLKDRNRKYYENNKSKIQECQKKYILKNKNKLKEINYNWRLNNKEKYLKYQKNYSLRYRETKSGKEKIVNAARKRRAIKNNAVGFFDWKKCLKIYNYRCAWCGQTENLQADHIWPISHGGSNWQFNIQPLCIKCNRLKSNKVTNVYKQYICFKK